MSRKKKHLLGEDFRKCQPKLRMIANGSSEVNALRAEQSASVAVTTPELLNMEQQRGEGACPLTKQALQKKNRELGKLQPRKRHVRLSRGSLDSVTSEVVANVFIETLDASAGAGRFPGERARKLNLVTARVPLSKLKQIAADEKVLHVELGEPLAPPAPDVSAEKVGPPKGARQIGSAELHKGGKGVLIGIIDVQGFDFSHPDFLDERGRTRFVRIWDQGAEEGFSRPSPEKDGQFDYGAELTNKHLNAALTGSKRLGLPPYQLERQSQMVGGSHGTHVASIAAGNFGVCPEAMIAGVVISLPEKDEQRRKSFYDSTRVADAVDYLVKLSRDLSPNPKRPLPLSINVSLGTNGHAHDGSSAISRWIDAAMSVPGRCISVAAGNAGQEKAEFEGDLGYVMGRIHTSGQVPARGLVKDVGWIVVGNGLLDISENELELWYSPQDRFAVELRPPGSAEWIGPVEPQQFIENRQLPDGSFVSIYNELYHPANGANYISLYLSPFLTKVGVVGVPAGRWTVRLHGREVRDGAFHGWIERDDPGKIGRVGEREAWRFPSFFAEDSNVDDSSVSSLACGHRVISVANLDDARERINVTSSQGPTRDNRFKPDTAAPGTDIVAAKGFAAKGDEWVKMTGTSMASPYVCGVAGLMLAAQPKLTAAQVEGIIVRTAKPLPGGSFKWENGAGFGRIDPNACVKEAAAINQREDLT